MINRMYNQFIKKPKRILQFTHLPKAIICDIDGTLAIMGDRNPFDWDKVGEDSVNESVANCLKSMSDCGYDIILMSGRDSVCLMKTLIWLKNNAIHFDHLYMRPEGNTQKDSVIKHKLFLDHVHGKHYVSFVLDDRDQMVKMWREIGLSCFQVNYGNF